MSELEKQLRIIIIDDDPDWCLTFAQIAQALGHSVEPAHTLEEAQYKIKNADDKGESYSIAIVDMNFEAGSRRIEIARGKEAVKFIKTHHRHIACIMISGSGVTPDNVLDLRDEYDLDYYVQKDRVDLDTLPRAFQKALLRVNPVDDKVRHLRILQDSLKKWRGIRALLISNLALAKEKEAREGVNVAINIINEIKKYTNDLNETEEYITKLEQEIKLLEEKA